MLIYPDINPIAFHLGTFPVHWYGLMYLLAFFLCWSFLAWRIRYSTYPAPVTLPQLSDIVFYSALGAIIGGRVGYMLFYGWNEFMAHPTQIFAIWQGGMSFHGGLSGVIVAIIFYSRKIHKNFFDISDFVIPPIPLGLAAGRVGNFINGELWGRVSDVPWAMVFPQAGELPRHPSQGYEFLLEGIILFFILWFYSRHPRPRAAISGLFLFLYGLFRFCIEFFREPDAQLGFIAFDWMTQGQLLSIPMIIIGVLMLTWAYRRKFICNNT